MCVIGKKKGVGGCERVTRAAARRTARVPVPVHRLNARAEKAHLCLSLQRAEAVATLLAACCLLLLLRPPQLPLAAAAAACCRLTPLRLVDCGSACWGRRCWGWQSRRKELCLALTRSRLGLEVGIREAERGEHVFDFWRGTRPVQQALNKKEEVGGTQSPPSPSFLVHLFPLAVVRLR